MKEQGKITYHLLALFTIIVWGTTYVSTKVLLLQGFNPVEILICRFSLAYVFIWIFSPKKIFSDCWTDELQMLGLGLFGGSLYFMAENTSLSITLVSNVSLITATAPILTAIVAHCFSKGYRMDRNIIYGSIVALIGVIFVVYNGNYVFKINPIGDFLAFCGALMWAFYGLLLKRMGNKYSSTFITRKVFFYGVVTLIPIMNHYVHFSIGMFRLPEVWGNLLFLGLIASFLCYLTWNVASNKLGVVCVSNYIYVSPAVTLISAAIVLHERITLMAIVGAAFILLGVYVAQKGFKLPVKRLH